MNCKLYSLSYVNCAMKGVSVIVTFTLFIQRLDLCKSTALNYASRRGHSVPVFRTEKGSSVCDHTHENSVAAVRLLRSMKISCILSDIDGTFITDGHEVSSKALEYIKVLQQQHGILFFPATGRTRKSMMDVTNNTLSGVFNRPIEGIPGVYSQGLQVYDLDGQLIYERYLESRIIERVETFCEMESLALIAYGGERILCKQLCAQTNKLPLYSEPIPDEFPLGLRNLEAVGNIKANKVIILADEPELTRIRPRLAQYLGDEATITKAVPGMLEVLPYGASKGEGVRKLLEHYNISLDETVAFGDGENDVEMLELVRLGIAVDNAKSTLKDVAQLITLSNNDDGVGSILELVVDIVTGK